MKLILFIIDVSHTQDDVPPSLPSKEPKLVMFYVYKLLNQQNWHYNYTNKKYCVIIIIAKLLNNDESLDNYIYNWLQNWNQGHSTD